MSSFAQTVERRTARRWRADSALDGSGNRLNLAGDCLRPVEMFYRGLPDPVAVMTGTEPNQPIVGYLHARCRKCETCMAARSKKWAARALSEMAQAPRTWFGTLTIKPEEAMRVTALCRRNCSRQGFDFDTLDQDEQFSRRVRLHGKSVTDFIKRVRHHARAPIRYLVVWEPHKSGLPHAHILVHETQREAVTKRILQSNWRLGFSQFKEVHEADKAPAWYVAKYLAKTAQARIRASAGYGRLRLLSLQSNSPSDTRDREHGLSGKVNEMKPQTSE